MRRKLITAEELALLDVLHQLWNEHSEQAATNYFGCYGKLSKEIFPRFVTKKNTAFRYGTELNSRLSTSWKASKDKIPFSRALLDSIRSTDYPVDSVMLQRLQDIRELALLEGMLKTPTPGILSDVSRRISKRKVHRTSQRGRKQTALSTCGKRSFFRKFQSILRQCRYAEIL